MKNNRLVYILIIILTIWCITLTTMYLNVSKEKTSSVVNNIEINGISSDLSEVVSKCKDSIVSINASGTISSGFVYKQDGNNVYILTSYHGLADAGSYIVYFANNYSINAELVDKNIYEDIALLKVNCPYEIETLKFADSDLLKSGEFVISIGTPSSIEYDNSVELGVVSNTNRTIPNSIKVGENEFNYYTDVVQLSGNLKPGYSGSPIINMIGEVVGMCNMSLDNSFNFAVPANEMKLIADKFINGEKVVKYQLNIKGELISNMPMYERSSLNLSVDILDGLYISEIMNDSICQTAGLKVGDVITSINGTVLKTHQDYLNVVYTETSEFEFNIVRDGQPLTLKVDIND